MSERVEYGVACHVETFWPRWNNWLASFRAGRWMLAQWLARESESLDEIYACGPHRVVKRTITEEAINDA